MVHEGVGLGASKKKLRCRLLLLEKRFGSVSHRHLCALTCVRYFVRKVHVHWAKGKRKQQDETIRSDVKRNNHDSLRYRSANDDSGAFRIDPE